MAIWHVAPLRFAPAFRALGVSEQGTGRFGKDVLAKKKFGTFRQIFLPKRPPPCFCRNVFSETSCSPLGYVPISSSAPRPLGAAYMPILLSEVEQEQRPSGKGDREGLHEMGRIK